MSVSLTLLSCYYIITLIFYFGFLTEPCMRIDGEKPHGNHAVFRVIEEREYVFLAIMYTFLPRWGIDFHLHHLLSNPPRGKKLYCTVQYMRWTCTCTLSLVHLDLQRFSKR